MTNDYIIGIDLGTTNSAVTYIDLSLAKDKSTPHIETFEVPQLTGPGEISQLKVLPSFLYLPGGHELNKDSLCLPWASDGKGLAGSFARDQGAKVPKRMVSSAKSWLCHGKVDRQAPILPWGADEEVERLSPIEATSAYLRHIKEAWNHAKGGDEDLYLENQAVVITVPASFDEVARDLTVEAASQAGIDNITLLEEPLAAFYSWLNVHDQGWDQAVRPGDLILVCDVGGGTTDFTLITLREKDGGPVFERIAVGDHLILGGDNMDLALAHLSEGRFQKGRKGRLNIDRWQALCTQCRQAKEEILSGLGESKTITLVGEGRRLVAGAVSAELSRKEIEEVILDGFFPLIEPGDTLSEEPRQGMTEFGLPYAQDPGITRHLIRFLEQHRDDISQILGRETPVPDLILFNGAALKPSHIQERIRLAIAKWFDKKEEALLGVLVNPDFDLAVALGASYYGLVRKGYGVRVDSGSARAYYLGVFLGANATEKGRTHNFAPEMAICLVERGMAEGTKNELTEKRFYVLANQPVRFYLYSSSYRTGDRVGDVVNVDNSLSSLPPLHTVIKFGKKAKGTSVPVKVEAYYTEVGTLALWCRSIRSIHRWRFQFQLRETDQAMPVLDKEVFEESLVDQALQDVRKAFSAEAGKSEPARLMKAIAATVDRPKERWPLSFIRQVGDELASLDSAKKRSLEHESRWLNLIGFCLRPGFGDALDDHRIRNLWKIFNDGPVHAKNVQVRSEWWVLWRRVAGGLSANQQRQVLQVISALVRPGKGNKKIRLAPQEHMEIWMAVANMERISLSDKVIWGSLLLDSLPPKKGRSQYWWSLSRLGAREPLYGPIDLVAPPDKVTSWIESILSAKCRDPRPVGMALAQMARLTGDRGRDLKSTVIQRVIDWLTPYEWAGPHIKILKEVVPIAPHEESLIFGESLPSGIQLRVD